MQTPDEKQACVPRTSYLEASEYAREKMLVESPSTSVLKNLAEKTGENEAKTPTTAVLCRKACERIQ
jgi:hypothetical protein